MPIFSADAKYTMPVSSGIFSSFYHPISEMFMQATVLNLKIILQANLLLFLSHQLEMYAEIKHHIYISIDTNIMMTNIQ